MMLLRFCVSLLLLLALFATVAALAASPTTLNDEHDVCIVGGGPGGIQLAYFLHRYGLDYVVLERNQRPGSFFEKYPRQRKLISINKVYTGTNDTEFNLRHDWNSLLNGDDDFFFPRQNNGKQDDDAVLFKDVSEEYYPNADTVPQYLEKFLARHPLNIAFGVEVERLLREDTAASASAEKKQKQSALATGEFFAFLSNGKELRCKKAVVLATGKAVEKKFKTKEGNHLVTYYTDAPTDPEDYNDQAVLIVGGGNAAFELAHAIESNAALVHIASRNPIQMAHQTHYVGDVRAVNLGFLDRYQLKSNDALIATPSRELREERFVFDNETRRIKLMPHEIDPEVMAQMGQGQGGGQIGGSVGPQLGGGDQQQQMQQMQQQQQQGGGDQTVGHPRAPQSPEEAEDHRMQHEASEEILPSRRGYDRVIICAGFRWNSTPFYSTRAPTERSRRALVAAKNKHNLVAVAPSVDAGSNFVEIASNFESVNVPDLFVAGALAHFRDFKRSAGGFVHGFRYTARTLAAMLRERYTGENVDPATTAFPSVPMRGREEILRRFLYRLKNVSSLYQMQGQLCDAVIIDDAEFGINSNSNSNNKDQIAASAEDTLPSDDDSATSAAPIRYFQDLPLDNIKTKVPELVSIDAFKPSSLHFLTLSLEFGPGFQGVGTLHHHPQRETYRRRAEKMLWDPAVQTADPDLRHFIAQKLNPGKRLPRQEKVTAHTLMVRDEEALQGFENVSVDLANLLWPLEEPPTMMPPKGGRPPKLSRFLFLHPVVREWRRTPNSKKMAGGVGGGMPTVKTQLIREVRLHEDVLNDFTGFYYHETPVRNFLDSVFNKMAKKKKTTTMKK